jgi:hypothetical protein
MKRLPCAIVLLSTALSTTACQDRWYSVPPQRQPPADYHPHAARVVNMDDYDADLRFVRDIAPKTDTSWRWTGQRPAIKIKVRAINNLTYTIDFTLPDITFKYTGPVTVAFTVNDHVLDRVRYDTAGYKHFEKEVPPEWLTIDADAIIGAELDKMWTSPGDGKSFGIILTQMGLKQ